MGQTILIVEDDKDLRENICSILQNEGFQTTEAQNGTQALDKLLPSVSLVILDIMMPGISGIETCQQIRSFSYVPILFLTARSSESNKAQGLYAGGDDYLTKPFSYIELVARVRALLRRNECYHYQKPDSTPTETREQLQRHDIILTVNPPQVTVRGILTELTDTEYQLLYLFLKYPTKIFSIQNLYESIWQEPFFHILRQHCYGTYPQITFEDRKKSAKTNTDTDRLGKGISFWIIRDIHLTKKVNTFIITK